VDFAWWKKDVRENALTDGIQKFLYSQGVDKFADRYTLDGKPLGGINRTGLLATTAVSSQAATNGVISKAFVEALWNAPVPSGEQRFYDGMLYLMSMMHVSGNFRIY
jgi:oligosaccharide reducing-end xylanase